MGEFEGEGMSTQVTVVEETSIKGECCETIHTVSSINFEEPFPSNIFNGKNKPFKASLQEKLRALRKTERVFVKKVSRPFIKYIDDSCQFEVLNKLGQPIFFAIDTTDAWTSIIMDGGVKPFNVMIIDDAFEEMFKIDGQPGLNRFQGVRVLKPFVVFGYLACSPQNINVNHNGKLVGKIIQEDMFCSFTPTYIVQGANGVQVLKIVGPENANSIGMPPNPTFEIYLMDETSLVGRITKQCLVFGSGTDLTTEETYILHFHTGMDLKTKSLLLATVFMLDFQFFHKAAVAGGITTSCWVWFSVLFFTLVIIVLIGIYLIKALHVSS